MLERYMTEDSAWSGPNRDLPTREGGGGLFVSEMRFPWGRQQEEARASYPRIFLKAIHMEVARRKVGDYYETEEKLTVQQQQRVAVEHTERGEAQKSSSRERAYCSKSAWIMENGKDELVQIKQLQQQYSYNCCDCIVLQVQCNCIKLSPWSHQERLKMSQNGSPDKQASC